MLSIHSEVMFLSGSKIPQETAKSGSAWSSFCSLLPPEWFWARMSHLAVPPIPPYCHHSWNCLLLSLYCTYSSYTLISEGANLRRGRSYWTGFSSLSHQINFNVTTSLTRRFSLLFANWLQYSMSHVQSHLLLTQSHLRSMLTTNPASGADVQSLMSMR